jgi:predicted RNase H-like nuclease (RuvC/YqgF family)
MLARQIEAIKREISVKERRIENLKQLLSKLEAQPDADAALVQQMKALIEELKSELPRDRSDLAAFENEFAASCGP